MTVIPGKVVPLPAAGGAACEVALPVNASNSDAELERRSVLLARSVIVVILIPGDLIR